MGGSKLPRSAPCEPEPPARIPQGLTPPAPTPDGPMGPPVVQAGAARALLPGTPLCDSGSVDADVLVSAPQPQMAGVGPPVGA
jgi:hypothetical protein